MSKMITLVACSGLNPRGNVTRAAVSDITSSEDNYQYACIVACGGNNQKHIQRTKDTTTIAVNGCQKACPKKILENVGGKVDACIDIKALLSEVDKLPEDTARIGPLEEEGIVIIKEEIYKVSKSLK